MTTEKITHFLYFGYSSNDDGRENSDSLKVLQFLAENIQNFIKYKIRMRLIGIDLDDIESALNKIKSYQIDSLPTVVSEDRRNKIIGTGLIIERYSKFFAENFSVKKEDSPVLDDDEHIRSQLLSGMRNEGEDDGFDERVKRPTTTISYGVAEQKDEDSPIDKIDESFDEKYKKSIISGLD